MDHGGGKHDVFISYADADRSVAELICAALEANGISCWIRSRHETSDYTLPSRETDDALGNSRIVVLVYSGRRAEACCWAHELDLALDRKIPVIPFVIADAWRAEEFEYLRGNTTWFKATDPLSNDQIAVFTQMVCTALHAAGPRPAPGAGAQERIEHHHSRPSAPKPGTRRRRPDPSPTTKPALVEDVHFGVTTPASMAPGMSYVVDVWAFLERQRDLVQARARQETGRGARLKSQGPALLARGARLRVRLSIGGLQTRPAGAWLFWRGKPTNASFSVGVPPEATAGQRTGEAVISAGGIPILRVQFVLVIGEHAAERRLRQSAEARRRTAFACYASADRRAVLARVHGLSKAGVDVFVDVKDLRSGDRYERVLLETLRTRDVFYLFWSRAAMESAWVEKEWRCALATRGIDFIDPVPLVSPDRVPPPPELVGELHFDDWHLAYLDARKARSLWRRL
jgi:hypothetical protein